MAAEEKDLARIIAQKENLANIIKRMKKKHKPRRVKDPVLKIEGDRSYDYVDTTLASKTYAGSKSLGVRKSLKRF